MQQSKKCVTKERTVQSVSEKLKFNKEQRMWSSLNSETVIEKKVGLSVDIKVDPVNFRGYLTASQFISTSSNTLFHQVW